MSTARTMAFDCADPVREDWQDGVPDHFVMTDPEGNEFCVV